MKVRSQCELVVAVPARETIESAMHSAGIVRKRKAMRCRMRSRMVLSRCVKPEMEVLSVALDLDAPAIG